MSDRDVETVRRGYDEFNRGNAQWVVERMDPDVEWTEPGGANAPGGTFTGPDDVSEGVFAEVLAYFDEFLGEPEDFVAKGDTVIVTGRFKGRNKKGAELDSPFEHTYVMKDGKIRRFECKVDPQAWIAAWS